MVLDVLEWVVEHLESKGWIVWKSDREDQAGLIALHTMYNQRIVVAVKPRLRSYNTLEATLSQSEYKKLLWFCDSGPVWIMFVDAHERCIYAYSLDKHKDQVRKTKDKVYLHLTYMKFVRALSIEELRALEAVPAKYAMVQRFFDQ